MMFNLEVWQEYSVFHLLDAPLGTPTQPAEAPHTQLSPKLTEELPQYNPSAQGKRQSPAKSSLARSSVSTKVQTSLRELQEKAKVPHGAGGTRGPPGRTHSCVIAEGFYGRIVGIIWG